jgi:hypothetical protein
MIKNVKLNIKLTKSEGNYPYTLMGDIMEQNICCGFCYPISKEDYQKIEFLIENQRKAYEEHEKVNVKINMVEDCRARQTTLWV